MTPIISYIVDNADKIIFAATSVVTAASAVAALTPSPKDDGIVLVIRKIINWLALNVGNAKSK